MILQLKLMRMAKGLSQSEVAEELSLPQSVYSLLETGRLKPSAVQAHKLEAFFGEPIEKLVRPWRQRSWKKSH